MGDFAVVRNSGGLTEPEKFMLEVYSIPRVKAKLSAILFKLNFKGTAASLALALCRRHCVG
jgi:hypothetical protein